MRHALTMLAFVCLLIDAAPAQARGSQAQPLRATVMPPVVGMVERNAVEQLRLRDLDVRVVHVVGQPVGRVVRQDPKPGSRLRPGAEVVVHVGIEAFVQTIVPSVMNQKLEEATARLELVYVLEVVEVPGPGTQVGYVLRQDPPPSSQLPFRGVLRLYVGAAPRVVPNVVGQNAHVARRTLRKAGLRAEIERVTEPHVVNGLVLAQEPAAGEPIRGANVVRLKVATHEVVVDTSPAAVPCPDLHGLDLDDACTIVTACGFVPHPELVRGAGQRHLAVVEQKEPAGTGLAPGAHVHFAVAHKPGPAAFALPSLLGSSLEHAAEHANALGLRLQVQRQPSRLAPGTILASRPHAGVQVRPGMEVAVLVAAKADWGWQGANVRLPDVRGRGLETARRALYGLGLDVRVTPVQAPNAALFLVTEQRPAPGTRLVSGQAVQLFVPLSVKVPDVRGQRLRRATRVLQDAGLRADARGAQAAGSPNVRGFRVAETHPVAGERVAQGSVVQLRVEPAGPDRPGPVGRIIVPNFVGMPIDQARARCQALGLNATFEGIVPGGIAVEIYAQSLTPGDVVSSQTPLVIRCRPVAQPSAKRVVVPDVKGKSRKEAMRILQQAGFQVGVRGVDVQMSGYSTKVRKIRPPAGTPAERGSKVIITLGF